MSLPVGWRPVREAAAAVVVFGILLRGTQAAADRQEVVRHPLDAGAYVVFALVSTVLVARTRRTWLSLMMILGLVGSYLALGYPYGPILLAVGVAVFVAADRSSVRASVRLLLIALGVLVLAQLPGVDHRHPIADSGLLVAISVGLVLPPAWLGAIRQRARQGRAVQVAEQRHRLGEERLALAREVHDVVAHNLSMVSIQAGAALRVFDRDPERAREALQVIHRTNQESLADLRRALDVLRSPDDPGHARRGPAPGLARVPDLVSTLRESGTPVELVVDGVPAPVPAMIDQAAFRIVQESLTNVVRHAGGAPATVRVRYAGAGLTLGIRDRGPGARAAGDDLRTGTGSGLAGARERAEAAGGWLESGTSPDGGFEVRAWLPLTPPDSVTDP